MRGLEPGPPLAHRLLSLQAKIVKLFDTLELREGDILVCEAATTMRDPRAALLVEQVRGMFEVLARSRGVTVPGRINPRTVQFEVMGLRGAQGRREEVKRAALQVAKVLYGARLKALGFDLDDGRSRKRHQDVVDALLVGSLAVSRVQGAWTTNSDLNQTFDLGSWRSKKRPARLRAVTA